MKVSTYTVEQTQYINVAVQQELPDVRLEELRRQRPRLAVRLVELQQRRRRRATTS